MAKRMKSQQAGHDYFEKLNDKLIVESIFTKLSGSDAYDTLNHIKSLGQCSAVCKRFNALTCQVSKLCISHDSIAVLRKICPAILKKFNNVYSIQVKHWSSPEILFTCALRGVPGIHWGAAYRPHSYCLALISHKRISWYSNDQDRQYLMRTDHATAKDDYLSALVREYVMDLIRLHHMLISSIKDHKSLQRLVVTDRGNRGTLTLENNMLRELRDCRSTNLKQVQVRDRSGCVINFDMPGVRTHSGVVMNNLNFYIIEWWEKASDDEIHNYKNDDDRDIPRGLPLRGFTGGLLKYVLGSLLKNTDVKFNDNRVTLKILSELMSGYRTPEYFC